MRVFISYAFEDQIFVLRVAACLRKQSRLDVFCYHPERGTQAYPELLSREILTADAFVVLHGKRLGETQQREIMLDFHRPQPDDVRRCLVMLGDARVASGDEMYFMPSRFPCIEIDPSSEEGAENCARQIVERLARHDDRDRHDLIWETPDGLPDGYVFDYEKDIIEAYKAGNGTLDPVHVERGCPERWPEVRRTCSDAEDCPPYPNPVSESIIGKHRSVCGHVLVDARHAHATNPASLPGTVATQLSVPEAGPRSELVFPGRNGHLGVGILVSGGIAPGINAVISGVVNRHFLYHQEALKARKAPANRLALTLDVWGVMGGFKELLPGRNANPFRALDPAAVRGIVDNGGSCLTTSRADELLVGNFADRDQALVSILDRLHNRNIDILYVIGGDGSMRAAHALWKRARAMGRGLSVVCIPKTMDNDILWVWQSFGFMSSVEVAKRTIMQLQTEVNSNPRLCVLQLFGSDSGFVVSHAALASSACLAALIPEIRFSMADLAADITRRLQVLRRNHPSYGGIIAMAETAVPVDWANYQKDSEIHLRDEEWQAIADFETSGRRIRGQTPDELRTGGLRLVTQTLKKEIRKLAGWGDFRVFSNEPRHLIRTIKPSVSDIITAQRMGGLAVDNAMAGYTDFLISQWLTEFVLVPLELVVLGRKRVPQEGIFWKSVLASTGQPEDLAKTHDRVAKRKATSHGSSTSPSATRQQTRTKGSEARS